MSEKPLWRRCDPNLSILCVRTGPSRPRIAMFAAHDIPGGGELSISYGDAPGLSQQFPGTRSYRTGVPHLYENAPC